jgi:hypothetical protein
MFGIFTGGSMPIDAVGGAPDLGGWNPEELRLTVHGASAAGSDHDIDAATRFVRGVATVVRRREALDKQAADPKKLSVFLLAPSAPETLDLAREPMLDAGLTPIAGKLWFVNAPVVTGKARPLGVDDPDGVFRTVTDELGLGDLPAVVVDPRLPKTAVRYYPRGLKDADACEQVRLHCADVDLRQVCEVIERVYDQCLITPDAQPQGNRLWKEASKHRPHVDAEHRIQAFLKPAFAAAFPTCRTYDEFAGTMGRADLHLEEPDPIDREKSTFLVVLELKVLRTCSETGTPYSDGDTKDWVEKGVKQAGSYRKERGHRVAALVCFDMRAQDNGDACFAHVQRLAAQMQVSLRRWYLYASAELCRDAKATTGD